MKYRSTVLLLFLASSAAAQTPLTEALFKRLLALDPQGEYTAYSRTATNTLPEGWLLQTPNVWNMRVSDVAIVPLCFDGTKCDDLLRMPFCSESAPCKTGTCVPLRAAKGEKVCVGQPDKMLDAFYDIVSEGSTVVDIATLSEPDIRYLGALRRAVTKIAESGKPSLVRVLIGEPPGTVASNIAVRNALVADAWHVSGSKLKLTVAVYRLVATDWLYWNHAKIVANDRSAIVGGQNLWTNDYLLKNVVHDLNMRADGPSATYAHRFLDRIWSSVCSGRAASFDGTTLWPFGSGCFFPHPAPDPPRGTGNVSILTVGNYSEQITIPGKERYASDIARNEAFRMAERTIRMSQQDIGLTLPVGSRVWWPDKTLEVLGDALIKNVDVYIVLSNQNAVGGNNPYNNVAPMIAADKIAQATSVRPGAPRGQALVDQVCRKLHFATLRINDTDNAWPSGAPFANHSKFWMVDDRGFYIGSDNVYPAWLQEFGYVVDLPDAVTEVKNKYWNPLWEASKRTAISGPEAKSCLLNCEVNSWIGFKPGDSGRRFFGDVNGDGKADYCRGTDLDVFNCALAQPGEFLDGRFINPPGFAFGHGDKPRGLYDVNADGAADYCRFVDKDVLSCAISNGTSTFVEDSRFRTGEWVAGWHDQPRAFIDVNGDHRTDYCRFIGDGSDFRLSCMLATANGWSGTVESVGGFNAGYNNKPKFFVDLDSDGKAAYCRFVGKDVLQCAQSNGTKFVDKVLESGPNFTVGGEPRAWVDVNGDGRADYCREVGGKLSCAISGKAAFNDGGFRSAQSPDWGWSDARVFADVNGDKKADYCRVIRTGLIRCALAKGQPDSPWGTFDDTFETLDGFETGDDVRQFADVIGDVAIDYCRMRSDRRFSCAHISICHK